VEDAARLGFALASGGSHGGDGGVRLRADGEHNEVDEENKHSPTFSLPLLSMARPIEAHARAWPHDWQPSRTAHVTGQRRGLGGRDVRLGGRAEGPQHGAVHSGDSRGVHTPDKRASDTWATREGCARARERER
jgi:hypothetical protein